MNNKIKILIILTAIFLIVLSGLNLMTTARDKAKNIPLNDSYYGQDMYTPALPLLFEDLKNEVVKGPIKLQGYDSHIIDTINSIDPPTNRRDEKYYYKIVAKRLPEYKKIIEDAIWEKFKEKSKLIDKIEWTPGNAYHIVLYAMVKKDVEFMNEFEILDTSAFDNSKDKFKYFGIKDKNDKLKNNVKPLFYKDKDNYAILLHTKTNDEIILYRGDINKPVNDIWKDVKKRINQDEERFSEIDKLMVPFINLDNMFEYKELADKQIQNTNLIIKKVLESVEFKLDNKGAKLKNEALMLIERNAVAIDFIKPRFFYFDKPFVLFMKEADKKNPYFMLKIKDTEYLVK